MDFDFLTDLSLKIAASVIGALIVAALAYVYRTAIISYLQSITYNGLDVSGVWTQKQKFTETGEDIAYETRLELQQTAHRLKGSWLFIKHVDGKKEAEASMRVTGELLEGFVALNLRSQSNKHLSLGSMLLKVHDGSVASGHYIFRNTNPNYQAEIANLPMRLVRERHV